jgi:hypothetical protein
MTLISEQEAIERHDEMLDEVCELITIGNLNYLPSDVLKAVDPIAYRQSLLDYLDSENLELEEEA